MSDAPADVARHLAPLGQTLTLDAKADWIESIDFKLFQSAVTDIAFQLCGATGKVQVQEWDKRLTEDPSSRLPLSRWHRRASISFSAMLLVGLLVAGWYSFRHPYFRTTMNSTLLWILAPLLGLALFRPISLTALPKQARRSGELVRSSTPALVLLLLVAALATSGNPSVEHATRLAHSGRVTDALTEASACLLVGREREQAAALHDQLHLQMVMSAKDGETAWRHTKEPFFSPRIRELAEQHALTLTAQAVAANLEARSFDTADAQVALVPEQLRDDPQVRPLRFTLAAREANGCIERLHIDCAEAALASLVDAGFNEADVRPIRERADEVGLPLVRAQWREITSSRAPIEGRLDACKNIDEPLRFVEKAGTGADLPVSRKRLQEICGDLKERQRLLEVRRQERAERARQARLRAWAYTPIRCNDGSPSPSCVCGQGSFRGCCSWHGGVDGCPVPYPN